jgi:excisionase family DNA binding protein
MQPLLTQDEAAELLKLSVRTMERLRTSGRGPKFMRLGNSIRYRIDHVEAWLASRLRGSTSEGLAASVVSHREVRTGARTIRARKESYAQPKRRRLTKWDTNIND